MSTPWDHVELGVAMGILDFGRATKLSGSREHPGDLLRAAGRSPARAVTVHRSMFPPAGRPRSRASPQPLTTPSGTRLETRWARPAPWARTSTSPPPIEEGRVIRRVVGHGRRSS
ncbi:hypothetical protein CUT44_17820 [Streptomyces carminius]|uniref:Uncharacterized protein n=1 Tax=Streptomyces carminius TaxID=2665496 RepID=A0A2M8LWN6_9ACTN|nr:hypothetical protein CUT44_17820 [Streptomyces carminius]